METDITTLVDGSSGSLTEAVDFIVSQNVVFIRKLRIERRYAKDDLAHKGKFMVFLIVE